MKDRADLYKAMLKKMEGAGLVKPLEYNEAIPVWTNKGINYFPHQMNPNYTADLLVSQLFAIFGREVVIKLLED